MSIDYCYLNRKSQIFWFFLFSQKTNTILVFGLSLTFTNSSIEKNSTCIYKKAYHDKQCWVEEDFGPVIK